jgi:hypothetical protein
LLVGLQCNHSHCSASLSQDFEYLLVPGKAFGLFFGKDELTVGDNLENTPPALDQFGFEPKFIEYGSHQTGGLWKVVSRNAIGDRYLHFRGLHMH